MTANQDRALLLRGANGIEIELARGLLSDAGIPCVTSGPDFDMAELGRAAHDMIRGQDLFVPASALERAREVLDEAWGDGPPGEAEFAAAGEAASGAGRSESAPAVEGASSGAAETASAGKWLGPGLLILAFAVAVLVSKLVGAL